MIFLKNRKIKPNFEQRKELDSLFYTMIGEDFMNEIGIDNINEIRERYEY